MNAATSDAKAIFFAALDQPSSVERSRYLDAACGSDSEVRLRVEQLLAAHDEAGQFLGGASPATIDTPLPERSGTQIGPYKLLQQIGEGGMGVVYMADQTEPVRRRVALKIIKPGMDTRQVIARFEAERQALAMMDHVNIARVLDGGATQNGRPYFVMELVHGVPITQYCDDHRLTPRQRLELFVPVCQAIQHAHQKGIIHRDIKPTNVMVTLYDGRPVAKVIDFGVAKATEQTLTERTLFTQYGTLVGTLEYMSPEQAEMSALGVDTRSDIFSLGVLLYELLTGSTPLSRKRVREAGYADALRMIKEEEPPKPSTRLSDSAETLATISAQRQTEPAKLTKLVRGELDWIVMKCLEKDRNLRYGTASSLVADVQRYLNDEAVLACPPSALYRFRKFARRNIAAIATATAIGLAVLLMMVGLATSLFSLAREQQMTQKSLQTETAAKDRMQAALNIESRAVAKAKREAYFQNITLAHHELSVDNLGRAKKHLDACPPELRKWEWRYLERLCLVEPLVIRDETEVNSVAFSPTGDRLISGNKNGEIKIWDSQSGRKIKSHVAHSQPVVCVAFHADGNHLATVGLDRLVKVWDLTTWQEVFSAPCDAVHGLGAGCTVAFGPGATSRQLAAGSQGEAQVWDWRSKQVLHRFAGHEKRSISVALSRDGRLASGDWRGSVKLWDVEQGRDQPLKSLTAPPAVRHPACALAFNHDGSLLASASFERRVDVWDTKTGKQVRTLQHSHGLALCVAFSPDGQLIASSGEEKTVHLWDAATGLEVLGLRGHSGQCSCVAFSPDPEGNRLASASWDGTIRIWDATPLVGDEAQELLTFTGHDNEIWSLAVSPNGQQVVSAGFSTPTQVWDLKTKAVSATFSGHANVVFKVAWQPPDGQRVATAGADGGQFAVKVWNAETELDQFQLPTLGGNHEFVGLSYSPDGTYLITGRADGTVHIWDSGTGELRKTLNHGGMVRGVVIHGQQLASLSGDGVIKLWPWDVTRALDQNWRPLASEFSVRAQVPGPGMPIAFSPDGRLAIGSEGYTVQIWDVQGAQPLQTLRGHSDDVYAVAFSPDSGGRWLASAGADSTVRVWDSHAGGRPVRTFRGHTGLVTSLAFTPDGTKLVSGSRDHTVKVWDMTQLERVPDR